jgi:hypothetical protein
MEDCRGNVEQRLAARCLTRPCSCQRGRFGKEGHWIVKLARFVKRSSFPNGRGITPQLMGRAVRLRTTLDRSHLEPCNQQLLRGCSLPLAQLPWHRSYWPN